MRITLALLLLIPIVTTGAENPKQSSDRSQIEAFNQKFLELHRNMDHEGILALWADDGVDLMPGEEPLVGKPAITNWLHGVLAAMPGAKISKQELEFRDIQVSGDWASEWGTEHQVVQRPGGDPIEGYGKIALVLHREGGGQWKIKQEMWNNSPSPRQSAPN